MKRFMIGLAVLALVLVAISPPAVEAGLIDPCRHPVLWKIFHPLQPIPPCPGPGPGPEPVPPEPIPPIPPTPPIPPPTPVAGFRVLIVHDYLKDGPALINELASHNLHVYLAGKCVEYRILNDGTLIADGNPIFTEAIKRPRASLPWIWMSDGKTVSEQPLPATVPEVIKLIDAFTITPTPPAPKSAAPQAAMTCDANGCYPAQGQWAEGNAGPRQPVRGVLRRILGR